MNTKLENVFGVSSEPILSYVTRPQVDEVFKAALETRKQIIVYGSSKQGKTALVSKYVNYKDNIVVRLSPETQITDMYSSILRQCEIKIQSLQTVQSGSEASATIMTKFKALIPFFGSGEAGVSGHLKGTSSESNEYQEIPFNMALAQDIGEILTKINFNKFIILENFHYLSDENQEKFAFDLRTFQEIGIRFIILGVWQEKNRMTLYNGDLTDRIEDVPVEPWDEKSFSAVSQKGGWELNIEFTGEIVNKCKQASFGSIGVYQELLKHVCLDRGIKEKQTETIFIDSIVHVQNAISRKVTDYSSRHKRALEAIAAGNISASAKDGLQPLYLHYYLVRVILESGYDGIATGMRRAILHEKIKKIHHRPDYVRSSDIGNLLRLSEMQIRKRIIPPIIDFNKNANELQIVDSTFYFFLKNADLKQILEDLTNPVEQDVEDK